MPNIRNNIKHIILTVCLGLSCQSLLAADSWTVALDAMKAKNWPAALTELNRIEKREPKNPDVHRRLGDVYRNMTPPNLPKALEYYQTAVQLDPNDIAAHAAMGETYLIDKKPGQAQKKLAKVEEICGNKTCEDYLRLASAVTEYRTKK
jgi:predicted Zn-dependent protease